MRDWTDEQLLARHRETSSDSERRSLLDELFGRHYQKVGLWCLRWCGSRDEAADLAQDIFAKVQRTLGSYEGSAKFTTWLFTVCRNHCFNAAESRRLRETSELSDVLMATLSSSEPDPETQLLSERRIDKARQLLQDNLDETERQVMVLHFAEGLSLPTVTRLLNLTNASGAKAFVVSAKRKLQAAIGRDEMARTAGRENSDAERT